MTMLLKNTRDDAFSKPFLEALLSGDKQAGAAFIHGLIKQEWPLKDVYEGVIKQALYQVGELWEHNKITVAEEHLATSISEAVMNELFAGIISPSRAFRKVVVACMEQEQHQVGAKMVADIFESKGWDSYFLGANIPVNELTRFVKTIKPDVMAVSASIYFHIPHLDKMIAKIRSELPSLPVLVGGQAFRHGGADIIDRHSNTTLITDLYTLDSFIDKFNHHEPGNIA